MKGRAPESVCVQIPDDKEPDSGFHDVTLVDMPDADAPVVPVADLNILRRQWTLSGVPGMSRKQTPQFRGECTWCCSTCGTVIKNEMARHFASFHLDLAQLWWCPVTRCTTWKGTPQEYIRQTTLGRNIRCKNLLRQLTWHAGFCHGQSPQRNGARP